VQFAAGYSSKPKSSKFSYTNLVVNQTIPDGQNQGVVHLVEVSEDVALEQVEITVDIPEFAYGGDLDIVLISPSGTNSTLAKEHGFAIALYVNLPLLEPESLYFVQPANFGPKIYNPINGTLIASEPADACSNITNCEALDGKMVLVDNSECEFTDQIYRVQECGGIGVIVVESIAGGPGLITGNGPNITISSVMISLDDGFFLKAYLANVSNVVVQIAPEISRNNVSFANWTFSTVRNWGESSRGNWTIVVIDRLPGGQGTLSSWNLHFYGYQPDAKALDKKWIILGATLGGVALVVIVTVIVFKVRGSRRTYNEI